MSEKKDAVRRTLDFMISDMMKCFKNEKATELNHDKINSEDLVSDI